MIKDIISEHYNKNYNRLVKKYSRWAGGTENAEDVVQTAYMRAVQYSDSFDASLPFESWFNRILNNSLKTFKAMEKGSFCEFNEEDFDGVPDFHFNRRLWQEITDEIRNLSNEEHKEILSLYYFQGYPPRSIVKVVDAKYSNVVKIVNRFKEFVKSKYGDEDESSSGGYRS